MAQSAVSEEKEYGTIFGKILLSKYDTMPEWVRVGAFLLVLLVMVYTTLHALNTVYFVTGTVLEPSPTHPGSNQFARGDDVRWADNYAGTNSKGSYVFVLTPIEYFSLWQSGDHALQIWKPGDSSNPEDQQICRKTIRFQRLSHQFDDYYIDGNCAQTDAQAPDVEPQLHLIPAVQAAKAATSRPAFRLRVETIRFATGWPRSDTAQMILFQNGEEFPLLNPAGQFYGGVTVLPGGSFAFSGGVSMAARSLGGGRIRLSDAGSAFRYTEEWFDLPGNLARGGQTVLTGSMGSKLTLIAG